MRKRWRVRWPEMFEDESPVTMLFLLCLGWCALGLGAMVVTGMVTSIIYGDSRTTPVFDLVMLIGEGVPFAIGFGVAVLVGLRWLLRGAIRRVTESGPDLRRVYHRED